MNSRYEVIISPFAQKSIDKLDASVQQEIYKKIKKIEANIYIGAPLERDLKDYYKLYACKKRIRIIYTIIDEELLVEVVSVGNRNKSEVYKKLERKIK